MQRKKPPTGIQTFREIRKIRRYYVDKTPRYLIAEAPHSPPGDRLLFQRSVRGRETIRGASGSRGASHPDNLP